MKKKVTMKQLEARLAKMSYGPNDILYISCSWNQYAKQWSAHVCSNQRRGFTSFIGIITRTYWGDTPEEATSKAIDAVPPQWAYEPDAVRVRQQGERIIYEDIPVERAAA